MESFIREISGIPKEGSEIYVFIKPPNSDGMKFKPKILKFDPENEINGLESYGFQNYLMANIV